MHREGSWIVAFLTSRTVWGVPHSSLPSWVYHLSRRACMALCLLSRRPGRVWAFPCSALGMVKMYFVECILPLWNSKGLPSYCNTSRIVAYLLPSRSRPFLFVLLQYPRLWLQPRCLNLRWCGRTLSLILPGWAHRQKGTLLYLTLSSYCRSIILRTALLDIFP